MRDYPTVELRARFRAGHSEFLELADKAGILPRLGIRLTFLEGTDDPRLIIGGPLLLAGLALLACYLPARSATKLNPIQAFRQD